MIRRVWEGMKSLRRGEQADRWDFEERRELVRMHCDLKVVYTVGSQSYQGRVVDMSLGGMLLRCQQPPLLSSVTSVTYREAAEAEWEPTVRCRVQWVKPQRRDEGYCVGLSYYENEEVLRRAWVKVILRQLGFPADRLFRKRKYVRVSCFIPVRVVRQPEGEVEGRLYNLAAKGALLEATAPVNEGEEVRLVIGPHEELAPLEILGRVVSCQEVNRLQFLGIEFVQTTSRGRNQVAHYLRYLLEEGGGI